MASNSGLSNANKAKKDEFYTQLSDIEAELKHYKKHFHGKIVLCNCDDPYESNFFKYFAMNFNHLGLKKLIATCYDSSPIIGEQISLFPDKRPYLIQITEVKDENNDGSVDLTDVAFLLKNRKNVIRKLKNGDFRSDECISALEEADIVCTNPPFSLFREYVALLMQYGKKFLIIGNQNAITYKEIFPLIKENKIWLGKGFKGNVGFFKSPYEDIAVSSQHKEGMIRVSGVMWFTNMDYPERHTDIELYKTYSPEEYPSYDNYNAIEVGKTADIPCDYHGIMGVPITFLDKFNPDQFDIVGMCENLDLYGLKTRVYTPQECRDRYCELFGKKGTYDLNAAGVVNGKKVYQRILIRRKAHGNQTT